MQATKHPSSKRYPPEVRERAVALVFSAIESTGERNGHVSRIARQLDIGPETLRHWVRQAEIDRGRRPGVSTEEHRRIVELERENRELRRANEILKAASAFFARELDPRLPR
jgi:transposase